MKLSKDPIEQRLKILQESFYPIAEATNNFIKNEYEKRDLFELCINFIFVDFIDSSKSDFESLRRVWLFPVQEAINEFGESLNKILYGSYKSAYDHLRRVLELIVIGSYFLLERIDSKMARQWLNSERETPLFSCAIKSLLENDRFKESDKYLLWSTKIKNFYWHLSDIIHVKGSSFSIKSIQPFSFSFNGIIAPQFSKENLQLVLDDFILSLQHIITIISLSNPILLVGLPLYEKFGLNPPLTGFFEKPQSEKLWQLMFEDFKPYFRDLVKNDQEIKSVIDWINSLPDISKEDLEKQMINFEKDISKSNI